MPHVGSSSAVIPHNVILAALCVSYARVSLDEQKVGKGVTSQHEETEEYGDEVGEPVQRRYEDIGISAFTGKHRPGYESLLADIAAGLIRIVIVWHADRLTRDVGEGRSFIALCRAHGVRLFSQQRGGEYNFARAAGRADFLRDIVRAEEESGHKGERVALSHKRRARAGEWGGGVRPFGWGVDTGRVRSKCINPKADIAERIYEDVPVLDMTKYRPDEAEEIRHWKDELLSGVPMNQILLDLAARGVLTASEKDRKKRNAKYSDSPRWCSITVWGILTNPRTAGHSVYLGEIVKWNAFDGIITEDERQALITLRSDPSRKTTTGNTPRWFGTMIFTCGQCKVGLMRPRPKGTGGANIYMCNTCHRGRQPALQLDAFVERIAVARLSRPDVMDLVAPATNVDAAPLRNEIATLQQRKTEISLSFARGDIDGAQLAAGTAELNKRLATINAKLSQAVGKSPLAPFALNHENAEKIWRGLTLGKKREILRTLMRVQVLQAPPRKRGKRQISTIPEQIDPSTIIVTPR